MRHPIRTLVAALVIVVAFSGTAAADTCVPVAPMEWNVKLTFVWVQSGATTWFEQNDCSWAGFDDLNGSDGAVLDVEGHPGPAAMTLGPAGDYPSDFWIAGAGGYLLDSDCNKIEGTDYFFYGYQRGFNPTPFLVTIPATAKWLVISNTTDEHGYPIDDPAISKIFTLQSFGVECPAPPPPPPHKKKKKH